MEMREEGEKRRDEGYKREKREKRLGVGKKEGEKGEKREINERRG